MFISPSNPAQFQMYSIEQNIQTHPQHSFWTNNCAPQLTDFQTEPEAVIIPHPELLCTDQSSRFLFGDDNTDFRLDPSSFFGGPDLPLQGNWTSSDPWKEETRCRSGNSVKLSGWRGRAGILGGVVQRVQTKSESPVRLNSTFRRSPIVQQSLNRYMSVYSTVHLSDTQHICPSLSCPPDLPLCSPSSTASTNYGTKCCIGQERKRNGEAAGTVWLQ